MGLFSTLNTGVTGLGVNSTSLAVAGDNLANLNTIGFKGSRAEFQDLIIQDVAGASRSSQLGMGAFLGGVSNSFTQGSISTTGRTSDFAVDGSGFFIVKSAEGQFFTRAGSFSVNSDNKLATLGGYALQGYTADDSGELGSSLGDITIGPSTLDPSATENVIVEANLDRDDPVSEQDYPWGGTIPATHTEAAAQCDFSTSLTVYDSKGGEHDVIVYFQKVDDAANTWEYHVTVDASETGGTEDDIVELESGTLDFDGSGVIESATVDSQTAVTFEGAEAQTIAFDLGADADSEGELSAFDSNGDGSSVSSLSQDGWGYGDLIDWQVSTDGEVTGVYSNGETQLLGQVALATFTSTEGLNRAGDNLWLATSTSGEPLVGAAESGSRGSIYQYALEGSNVDIENEFVSMITAQRGYQAAARVVSTTDQLLQELVNIM